MSTKEDISTGFSEPSVTPLSEVPPGKEARFELQQKTKDAGSMEVVILVDTSSSNKKNAIHILEKLASMVGRLPAAAQKVVIYKLDGTKALWRSVGTTTYPQEDLRLQTVTYTAAEPDISFEKTGSESSADFAQRLEAGVKERTLDWFESQPSQFDTDPFELIGIGHLIAQRTGFGSARRTVYIYLTDEDVKDFESMTSIGQGFKRIEDVSRKMSFGETFFRPVYLANVEIKHTAEAGGFFYGTIPLRADSCKKEDIDRAISDSNISKNDPVYIRALTGETYEKCHSSSEIAGGGSYYRTISNKITGLGGEVYSSDTQYTNFPTRNYSIFDEIKKLNTIPNQPQNFFGLFTIQNESEKNNPDQEVAVNIPKFLNLISSPDNRYFGSVASPNFSDFFSVIEGYIKKTTNNVVSISLNHKILHEESVINRVEFQTKNTSVFVQVKKFIFNGKQIILLDEGIDYTSGGQVRVFLR